MFYVEATDGFSVNVDRPQARIFASMVVRSDALNDVCKLITLSTISWPCGLNFELSGRIFIGFFLCMIIVSTLIPFVMESLGLFRQL